MRTLGRIVFCLGVASIALAAPRHIIRFGGWMQVQLFTGPSTAKSQQIQVRPLYVDSKIREFTTGEPHDVTDQMFVVRKALRVNDSLPEDSKKVPLWRWQRGGWLLIDRASGRVSTLNLPVFDPYYSNATWYRDYIAYCGVSQDGEKLYAVVTQIARKKPLIMQELGAAHAKEEPDSQCAQPKWQRDPARVTFEPVTLPPVTFQIHGSYGGSTAEPESEQKE